MPIADEPAPRTTMRSSLSFVFFNLVAASKPATVTASTLDVVIESTKPIAIALQYSWRVVFRKVFPLQQHMGKLLLDRFDKVIDKIIVFLATDAFVTPAEIKWIIQQLWIVRSHVEQDRQSCARMNA